MAKGDNPAPWLAKIGIDRTCRLVGMCRGMVVLTTDPDGWHTLWIYNYPLMSGDRTTVRNRYADFMVGDWLEPYYRDQQSAR